MWVCQASLKNAPVYFIFRLSIFHASLFLFLFVVIPETARLLGDGATAFFRSSFGSIGTCTHWRRINAS